MNFPAWATDPSLSDSERAKMRLRYLTLFAALHHNSDGSMISLANAAGFTANGLSYALTNGRMTAGMAAAIESVVGRDVVTKELLCPEKFATV